MDDACDDISPVSADVLAAVEESLPVQENPAEIAQKLRDVYGTNDELLRSIVRLFKYAFTEKRRARGLSEMTAEDLIQDIHNTKLTLPNFDGSISDILEAERSAKLFAEQLAAVPVLLDFIYVYFVNCCVEQAPLYRLPHNPLKFCLISDQLKKYIKSAKQMEYFRRAHQQFIHVIKDPIIQEFRQEDPPMIIRSTRPIEDIKRIMFGEVREKIRDLLATVSLVARHE